jgi:autotransporter-associated beta strand protein
MISVIDFAGHTADVLASNLTMASRTQNSGDATATLSFDQGTLDITALGMASRTGTGTGDATATINLGDSAALGTPTVTIDALTMAVNTSAGGVVTADLNVTGGNVSIGIGSGTAINMANAAASRTATSTIDVTGGTLTVLGNLERTGGAGTENATLTLNGGTLNMSNFNIGGAAAVSFTAASGTLQNVAEINNGGTLTKSTSGTLILAGLNAYTGVTNVNDGKLLVNGTNSGAGAVTVAANATLGGTGSIGGAVTVQTGGILSPGGSVESLNMPQGLTLNADSRLVFEFRETTGTVDLDPAPGVQSGAGVSWDLIDLGAGLLNLGATPPADKIELYLDAWKQDNSGHATLASENNFDPLAEYADGWLFIKADSLAQWTGAGNINDYFNIVDTHDPTVPDGGLTGVGGVFNTGSSNPFTRPPVGQFSVAWKTVGTQSGLYIQYSAIPEPGSMLLCGLGALGLGWYGRRRLKKQPSGKVLAAEHKGINPDETPA